MWNGKNSWLAERTLTSGGREARKSGTKNISNFEWMMRFALIRPEDLNGRGEKEEVFYEVKCLNFQYFCHLIKNGDYEVEVKSRKKFWNLQLVFWKWLETELIKNFQIEKKKNWKLWGGKQGKLKNEIKGWCRPKGI